MAEWRNFGATNEPDTCLWCGRKLRHKPLLEMPQGSFHYEKVGTHALGGDYKDGHFCGLRCAYQYAVALADHGRRLKPKVSQ